MAYGFNYGTLRQLFDSTKLTKILKIKNCLVIKNIKFKIKTGCTA